MARTATLVERYVDRVVADDPVEATLLGDHRRDGELPELTPSALDARVRHLDGMHADAVALHAEAMTGRSEASREAAGDLRLLIDTLDAKLFHLRERPRFELDPLVALDLVGDGLWELLRPHPDRTASDREDPAARPRAAVARAAGVPQLLEQAGRLLETAPRPHLAVALGRLDGLLALVRETLPASAAAHGLGPADVDAAAGAASEAIEAFGALLHELADEPPADWRLGPVLHRRVLRTAVGADLTVDAIVQRAQAGLARTRAELDEVAARVWPAWFTGERRPDDPRECTRRVIAAVADDVVERTAFVDEAGRALDDARAFCAEAAIVDLPPEGSCRLREVPPFQQGLYPAYVQPAPPLEPGGATMYLSPVPSRWSRRRAASFLREYNRTMLRSLAVHEAYPGHVVQLLHAAQHPRLARRLLHSTAFAEGWAVYAERLMVDHGFGDDAHRVVQLKMRLRIVTNALLDIGMHTGDLDGSAARRLLTEQAFQEDAEVRGKLVRAQITAGQLCAYFVGGTEVETLRAEVQAARGDAFEERAFHRQVLSHGTPPVSVLRSALLAPDAGPVERRPFGGLGVQRTD